MSTVLDRSRLLVYRISGSDFSKADARRRYLGGCLRPEADIFALL